MEMWALQAVLAFVYVNFLEWSIHKYILHGLGKKKGSFFSFHWRIHHRTARHNQYLDKDYKAWPTWDSSGKEILGLIGLAVLHAPLVLVAPVFYAGLVQGAVGYYIVHAYSHRNPTWAKKWIPWHYTHHMGKDQDANYCVTTPLFDHIMGTRKYQ